VSLRDLITKPKWSPRAEFPPSTYLSDRLFSCGDGFFLMTNPKHGEGDPVWAVGWSESDYWAARIWESPPFNGDLKTLPSQWGPPPSLTFLGRPETLSYAAVCEFERSQAGAKKATLLDARYRLTDGAFLFCGINGVDGITYIYASNEPKTQDEPVAIEFRLRDSK
jgi:hypothetical protein